MISKKTAELVLAAALSKGGDFAEIFLEDSRRNNISLVDGKIDTATTSRAHGAGIRVYKGLDSIYVHTNDTSEDGLVKTAKQAADAVNERAKGSQIDLIGSIPTNIHAIAQVPTDIGGARKSKLVHDAYAAAKSVDEAITQVTVGLRDTVTDVQIINSDGLFTEDHRVYTRVFVQAVAASGTENQTGYSGPGAMMGYELFESRVDVEAVGKEAAQMAATMLRADFCPAGVMPVVIDKGFGGVIFHEACGHSLEATSVALGNSEFCGKLGQRIAAPCVSAIDDGTIANEWGSINIDDEGVPTSRLVLIENGILKNYMVDRLNGRRMEMAPTGNARRQDYTFAPTSRMRNTYIAPGDTDEREIIATMGDGLYAKTMGGGSVNPATGEFNFSVDEGYLVKDGKIDRPVRGAMLIGRGGEVLMRIDRVGKELELSAGVCGSTSGGVPVTVGQPMIRVTSMTVGGR